MQLGNPSFEFLDFHLGERLLMSSSQKWSFMVFRHCQKNRYSLHGEECTE